MIITVIFGLILIGAANSEGQGCKDAKIFHHKLLNEAERKEVTKAHNKFRKMMTDGNVPKQPRGDVPPLTYDKALESDASRVTNQCKMEHILGSAACQGQNLYEHCSTEFERPINWTEAVQGWYDEYKDFKYPDQNLGEQIGHYTQLMWADTKTLGCRHIYYQKNGDEFYCRLYSCNYFPCGNIVGQAPYELYNSKSPSTKKRYNPGTDNNVNYKYNLKDENQKDAAHVTYVTTVTDENNKVIKKYKEDQITVDDDMQIDNPFDSFGKGINSMFNGFNNAFQGFFKNWF